MFGKKDYEQKIEAIQSDYNKSQKEIIEYLISLTRELIDALQTIYKQNIELSKENRTLRDRLSTQGGST